MSNMKRFQLGYRVTLYGIVDVDAVTVEDAHKHLARTMDQRVRNAVQEAEGGLPVTFQVEQLARASWEAGGIAEQGADGEFKKVEMQQ